VKLTAQQKVAIGLLAVAVGALIVDRLYFTPASAAGQEPVRAALPSAVAVARASISNAAVAEAPLGLISDELKSIEPPAIGDIPDAFQPSHSWLASQQPLTAAPVDHSSADFLAAHKLSGVLESTTGGVAIVDGQVLRVGQNLGDFRLRAVGSRWAEFTKDGNSVRLVMAP
jgi:hypothetical protein